MARNRSPNAATDRDKKKLREKKKKEDSGSSSSDSSGSSSGSSSSSSGSSSRSSGSSSRSSSTSSSSSSNSGQGNRSRPKKKSPPHRDVAKDRRDPDKEKIRDRSPLGDKLKGENNTNDKHIKVRDKHDRSPGRKKRERSPPPRPTRIHIGRLTLNVTREHINEIFSTYGVVKSVDFPTDRLHPHLGKGFAYVEFQSPDEAENAMKHMDGGQVDGQEITAAPVVQPLRRRMSPRRMSPRPPPRHPPPRRHSPPRYRRRSPMPRRRSPPRRRRSPRPAPRRRRSRSSSSSSR